MADMQVSNARRIIFTALALVVFWVVAWRAYGWGLADGLSRDLWNTAIPYEAPWRGERGAEGVLDALRHIAFLCFTILPAILLSFALYDLRDIWKTVWRGRVWTSSERRREEFVRELRVDAGRHRRVVVDHRYRRMLISTILFLASIAVCYRLGESDASPEHEVSWPWLLLPIVTTAFVIFGAWQRASPTRRRHAREEGPEDETVFDELERHDGDFDVFDE